MTDPDVVEQRRQRLRAEAAAAREAGEVPAWRARADARRAARAAALEAGTCPACAVDGGHHDEDDERYHMPEGWA